MSKQPKQHTARIVLIVAALLSALVTISSFGAALPLLPFAPITIASPTAASSNGSITAVAIDRSHRVALVNESSRLVALINLETFEAPIEVATDVCVSAGSVYVAGYKRVPDSDEIATERIVRYDFAGKQRGVVYEAKGSGTLPRIRALDDSDYGVIFGHVEEVTPGGAGTQAGSAGDQAGSASGQNNTPDGQADSADAQTASATEQASSAGARSDSATEQADATDAQTGSATEQASSAGEQTSTVGEQTVSAGTQAGSASELTSSVGEQLIASAGISIKSYRVCFRTIADGGKELLAAQELPDGFLVEASFSPESQRIATLSYRGTINGKDPGTSADGKRRLFTSIALDDQGTLYACENVSGALCKELPDKSFAVLETDVPIDRVRVRGDVLCAIGRDLDDVRLLDREGKTLTVLPNDILPSALVSARLLLTWVCAVFLACLALALAVRAVARLVREGRAFELAAPVASCAIVTTVAIALGSTSLSSYRAQLATRTNEVNANADFLATISGLLSEGLAPCEERTLFAQDITRLSLTQLEALSNALEQIDALARASTSNGIGLYVGVYGADKDGPYCTFHSLNDYVWGESVSGSQDAASIAEAFRLRAGSAKALSGSSRYEETLYRTIYVQPAEAGGHGVVIEVGSRMRSFASTVASTLFKNALALVVLVLVIYMGYTELRACGRCVIRYRRMVAEGERGAISALARPFALSSMMLTGIDGVMSTLIAKEILAADGYDSSTWLVAVPAIMLGIGQALGQGIYGLVGARVPLRRLMVRGGFAMLGCAILAAIAVASGSFWGYAATKLLLSIPFGLLYTAAYSLNRHAKTAEQSELADAGVRRSDTSSAALGTALGGYAAQILGNAWVYVAIAAMSVALCWLAAWLIPADARPPEGVRNLGPEEHRRMRAFLRSRGALAIALCIILPSVIASGYASFLFPLFSSEMGFGNADITNMYLIAQLIVYVSITGIELITRRIGNWAAGLASIAGLGVVFCAFSLNVTVVWGVVAIALVSLLVKLSNAWKGLWLAEARKAEIHLGWATGTMFIVRSMSSMATPFILGSLLVLDQGAVIVGGIVCLACAAVFWLTTAATGSR